MENKNQIKEEEKKSGVLYIVSTPIGNDEDISLRAMKVLKNCDLVICEEEKPAVRILRKNNISKDVSSLNEHNENDKTETYIQMLNDGKKLALISDCGTPIFADPGLQLVQTAIYRNIQIVVVPGPSSLMAALVRCGFTINTFLFAGFLSRNNDERLKQMINLSKEPRTVVLLEAPYRLLPVLETASEIMPNRKAYIGCNLTMHYETNHYGTFTELYNKFKNLQFKGEFVIVFKGNYFQSKSSESSKERFGFKKSGLKLRKYDSGNRDRR